MMKARKIYCFIVILSVIAIAGNDVLYGQKNRLIKGVLRDQTGKQPVAYATISLYNSGDSVFIAGTLSDENGEYNLTTGFTGKAFLKINFVGYKPVVTDLNIEADANIDVGITCMEEDYYRIEETVIKAGRIKARDEADKTTYMVNKKIYDVSNTGIDVLKHMPGVQVDLMQNVYLEGSSQILILVNGIQRDKDFIRQLNADMIDKVEIMPIPASKYDADITGVINILLKKEQNAGLNGQIYADIPARKSEIYSFPVYNINFNYKNLNVFTSCNGDMRYFDMTEGYKRILLDNDELTGVKKTDSFRQKDWSYRFHYGFDFFMNDRNLINFYSFYNPAKYSDAGSMWLGSWDQDGLVDNKTSYKKDVDKVNMSYYSLFYKHIFRKPAQEISCDVNYFNYRSDRTIHYKNNVAEGIFPDDTTTETRPVQSTVRVKIDFTTPLSDNFKLDAGMKTDYTVRKNRAKPGLTHTEEIYALYASVNYHAGKWNVSAGLRTERSVSGLSENDTYKITGIMPHSVISYSITSKQQLKLSYRRHIKRPMLNQLDSYTYTEDPFNTITGNPGLDPEIHDNLYLDYSLRFGKQYLSQRLFRTHISDVINRLSFLNDEVLETEVHNTGNLDLYGYRFTGSVSPHKALTVNASLTFFVVRTLPEEIALAHGIEEKIKTGFESGLSAIVAFKYDINASFFLNYNSAAYDIQHETTKDPLYFISLEKSFYKKLKIGVMACLPFTKTFNDSEVYTGTGNMKNITTRDINLTLFPVMFNIGYRFKSGKTTKQINRDKDLIEPVERDGL